MMVLLPPLLFQSEETTWSVLSPGIFPASTDIPLSWFLSYLFLYMGSKPPCVAFSICECWEYSLNFSNHSFYPLHTFWEQTEWVPCQKFHVISFGLFLFKFCGKCCISFFDGLLLVKKKMLAHVLLLLLLLLLFCLILAEAKSVIWVTLP